jgi:TonB family protein
LVCLFFSIAFSIAAASQTPSEPVAKQQTPQDALQAMVGQKLLLLQFGDADKTKLKKSDLNKVRISCDLAVQIKEAHQEKDKVIIAWEQIGSPSVWGKHFSRTCRDYVAHDKGSLIITGFAPDETADSLASSLSKVLQTPEQYLVTAGIEFSLPAEPDIQGQVPSSPSLNEAPKPLLSVDPTFSEQARKSKYQGTAVVMFYVGTDGRVHRPSIPRPLGMGLDQQALNVISLWRFRPAHRLDQPVPASMNVEIHFTLY